MRNSADFPDHPPGGQKDPQWMHWRKMAAHFLVFAFIHAWPAIVLLHMSMCSKTICKQEERKEQQQQQQQKVRRNNGASVCLLAKVLKVSVVVADLALSSFYSVLLLVAVTFRTRMDKLERKLTSFMAG